MKGGLAAAALAALAGSANAVNHRNAHQLFHKRVADAHNTCGCTTYVTTITGEPTLCPPKTTEVPKPTSTHYVKEPVPTPEPFTCDEPGTYTIPATTVTLDKETTVCVGTKTHVPKGVHTVGGVTTIVETATTVTCPVATVTTHEGVVTSTIINTEYVCPEAGTYTIAPITTTVTEDCDIEYPVPTNYHPGTYTAPEQVITVTETGYVTVCPYTTEEPPKPTVQPQAPKYEAPKVVKPKPLPKPEAPKYEAPEVVKPNPGKFQGSFGPSKSHYAITYTPFNPDNGSCKSRQAVWDDIKRIKDLGFNVVRLYSTECNTLTYVGDACEEFGVKIIVGVFVNETGCTAQTPFIKKQVDDINAWARWDLVELFVIGNEVIFNNRCSAAQLATLIKTVQSSCGGYKGPYTTAETLAEWQQPGVADAICGLVDYTGANVHPFFNEQNTASGAGKFVKGQLDILDRICSGKKSVNLESGWPSGGGSCKGTACPGKDEQRKAIESIRDECGDRTVFFSLDDDSWQPQGGYDTTFGSGWIFETLH